MTVIMDARVRPGHDSLKLPPPGDTDHIKSLDWRARKWKFICEGDETITREVPAKIKALISIP
jgi:hypothetical protein